jgi:hypothetical protein
LDELVSRLLAELIKEQPQEIGPTLEMVTVFYRTKLVRARGLRGHVSSGVRSIDAKTAPWEVDSVVCRDRVAVKVEPVTHSPCPAGDWRRLDEVAPVWAAPVFRATIAPERHHGLWIGSKDAEETRVTE